MKTYNDIYLAARRSLRDAGIDAYNLEARLIAVSAAEKTKEQFVRDMRLYAGDDYEEKVGDMIRRRIGGEPVAYITGEWEFYGLPLTISEDVLIPRTDTETLVDTAIEALKTKESPRILDLCAGSGCVGLALAANIPDCRVVMVDNSAKALRLCRTNILRNNLTRSITCVEADVLASPPMLLGLFDIIVSNPPYIPTADIAGLHHSVRDFEPSYALDGGTDGLDFYRSIVSKWSVVLKENGMLMFECGPGQAGFVRNLMQLNGFGRLKTVRDTLEIERVVAGTLH